MKFKTIHIIPIITFTEVEGPKQVQRVDFQFRYIGIPPSIIVNFIRNSDLKEISNIFKVTN